MQQRALATQDSTSLQHPLWEKGLCDRTEVIQELEIRLQKPLLHLRGISEEACQHFADCTSLTYSTKVFLQKLPFCFPSCHMIWFWIIFVSHTALRCWGQATWADVLWGASPKASYVTGWCSWLGPMWLSAVCQFRRWCSQKCLMWIAVTSSHM